MSLARSHAGLAVAHLLACATLLVFPAPKVLGQDQSPWIDPPASLPLSSAAPAVSADPPVGPNPPVTRPIADADLVRPAEGPTPASRKALSTAFRSRAATPSLTITNARAVSAADVAVRIGQGAATLARPLASGDKATLKLPKTAGCTVSIFAMFEDESVVDVEEFDICQKSAIRFTD